MQNHDGVAGRGRRARSLAAAATALLLIGSAAACGGDDEDGEGAEPAATSTTAAEGTTEATDAPVEGDDVLGPEDPASGEPLRIGFITDGQNAATDQSIELDVAEAAVEYINTHRAASPAAPWSSSSAKRSSTRGAAPTAPTRWWRRASRSWPSARPVWSRASGTPLHEAGVPTMFFAASGDTVLGDAENTFAVSNPQAGNISLPIAVAEENDLDKVTVIAIDVPAAYAGYEGSGAEAFEDAGVELEVVRIAAGTADMTPQLQPVFAGDPGVIHIIGNDTFCISAYQAMIALGFDGPQTGITQCVTDATRQAIPGDFLEGMNIASAAPVGVEDDSTLLYRTVMETYGDVDIDTSRIAGVGTFLVLNALEVGLEGLEGEVTPESVITTLRGMEEADLPGGGGIRFRCNGNALAGLPAVCSSGGLSAVLDATGNVTRSSRPPPSPSRTERPGRKGNRSVDHLGSALLGLGNGGVFAALALALVLTYRSSGVINFATGAIALYGAYTYAALRQGELLVLVPGFPTARRRRRAAGVRAGGRCLALLSCAVPRRAAVPRWCSDRCATRRRWRRRWRRSGSSSSSRS